MKIIKIYESDLKFCPYCGKELDHSSYYQEEDDLHYRGTVNVVECKKCKINF